MYTAARLVSTGRAVVFLQPSQSSLRDASSPEGGAF